MYFLVGLSVLIIPLLIIIINNILMIAVYDQINFFKVDGESDKESQHDNVRITTPGSLSHQFMTVNRQHFNFNEMSCCM